MIAFPLPVPRAALGNGRATIILQVMPFTRRIIFTGEASPSLAKTITATARSRKPSCRF
jgi:hypothetical protein